MESGKVNTILAAVVAAGLTMPAGPVAGIAGPQQHEVEVRTVPILRVVEADVRAVDEPAARARIGGILTELGVDEGTRVRAGEVIARVVDPELDSQIAAARARVARIEARTKQARRTLERQRVLFERDTVSAERVDEAVQQAADAANAERAARAEVETLLARRRRGDVLAPADGVVVNVQPTETSAVRPGALVARVAAEPSRVRISVPERHLPILRDARSVLVETPDGPRSVPIVKIYPDVRNGRVEAEIPLPEEVSALPVGRRVSLRLEVGTQERIVIPRHLVEVRQGLAYVHRVDAGRTLVQLGEERGAEVTILSGLRAGDRLEAP